MDADAPHEPGAATEPVCYRHPDRVTYLSCSECGKPICPDCSHDSVVGQKCADCAAHMGRGQVVTARQLQNQRTPVVTSIIVAAIVAFLAQRSQAGIDFDFGMFNPLVRQGEWWRAITSAFLHVSFLHIGFNMYALYLFGPPLERRVGSAAFSGLYLASALAGSGAFLFFGSDRALAMGASGAIFGLFGAVLMATWPVRHTALGGAQFRQLLVLLGINLALPLFLPSIAWQAHVGGMLAGILIVAIWQRIPQGPQKKIQQTAAAYAVAAVSLLTIFVG